MVFCVLFATYFILTVCKLSFHRIGKRILMTTKEVSFSSANISKRNPPSLVFVTISPVFLASYFSSSNPILAKLSIRRWSEKDCEWHR
jgi:hypothetical protein